MKKKTYNKNKKMDFGLLVNKKRNDKGSLDHLLKIKKPVYKKSNSNKFMKSKNTKRPYYSYAKVLDMNWNQVKKRYPGISPQGDADLDGTRNKFDCKPLDPSRDGKFGDFLSSVAKVVLPTKEGAAKFSKKVGGDIRKVFKGRVTTTPKGKKVTTGGFETQHEKFARLARKVAKKVTGTEVVKGKKGKKGRRALVGRPAGEYKTRINPFTGQPIQIPATEYYKLVKKYKQQRKLQQQTVAEQVDVAQVSQLTRRGIPPEQAKRIVDVRQLQQVVPEGYHVMTNGEPRLMSDEEMRQKQAEMPQEEAIPSKGVPDTEMQAKMSRLRDIKAQRQLEREQIPQQVVPRQIQYPQRVIPQRLPPPQYPQQYPQQRFKVKTDLMTGRRTLEQLPPPEKWTRPPEFRR